VAVETSRCQQRGRSRARECADGERAEGMCLYKVLLRPPCVLGLGERADQTYKRNQCRWQSRECPREVTGKKVEARCGGMPLEMRV